MTSLFESSTNKKIWNFSPAIIPGCVMWLDASDPSTVTISGENVTAWKDKSIIPAASKVGGATGLTPSGAPPIRLVTQNGLNTIAFNGGTSMLSTTTNITTLPTGTASGTYFVVARTTASPALPQIMFQYGSTSRSDTGTIRSFYFSSAAGRVPYTDLVTVDDERNRATGQYTVGDYTIISSSQPYSATGITSTSYINGNTFTNNESVTANPNIGTTRFSVGAGADTSAPDLTHYLTGNVAEILVYSTVLSPAEREQVEGYLGRKWGLSGLITRGDHPYRSTALVKSPYLKPFSPIDVSGCVAWFDASDFKTIVFTGANVSRWKDKSEVVDFNKVGGSTGVTATAPSPSTSPILETMPNGLNTFKFSGSNGFSTTGITSTSIPKGTQPGTYFVVGKTTSSVVGAIQMMFQYGDNPRANYTNRQFYFTDNGRKVFTDVNQTGRVETNIGQYTNGQYSIISSIQTLAITTLNTNSRINGTAFGVNNDIPATVAAEVASTPSTSVFSIGHGITRTDFNLTGNIGEILIYNVALSEGDRIRIEGYLAWKWGLQRGASSIPETHSFYKFSPATVTP